MKPHAHSHSHRGGGGLGTIAKTALVLTSLYCLFILFSVTRPVSKSVPGQRRSPHRKTLARPPTFFKRVEYLHYHDALPELLAEPGPHYVLFTSGTIDNIPEVDGGKPWCPDCFACGPVIRQLVSRAGGALLEVSVGSADEWHKEDNPLRIDVSAPVKYIPTLYHWNKDGPGARISNQLTRDEKEAKLKEIVVKFLKDTAGDVRSVVTLAQEILEKKGKRCSHC